MARRIYKIFMLAVSFAILAGIIWYANPVLLAERISHGNVLLIFIVFLLASVNVLMRTLKWKVLLEGVGLLELVPVQILGMVLSSLTPGKVGEPLKAIILKARKGIAVSKGLSTIIWERILDLVVLVILAAVFIAMMSMTFNMLYIGLAAIAIFIAGISVLLGIVMSKRIGMKVFSFAKKLPLLNRIGEEFMDKFYEGSKIPKSRIALSFIITAACWFLDGVIFYFSFLAIGIEVSPLMFAGIIAFSTLVAIASTLPGGLGSFEAVLIVLISSLGFTAVDATTGIMIGRVLTFWYGMALGALSFLWLSRKSKIELKI